MFVHLVKIKASNIYANEIGCVQEIEVKTMTAGFALSTVGQLALNQLQPDFSYISHQLMPL